MSLKILFNNVNYYILQRIDKNNHKNVYVLLFCKSAYCLLKKIGKVPIIKTLITKHIGINGFTFNQEVVMKKHHYLKIKSLPVILNATYSKAQSYLVRHHAKPMKTGRIEKL